MRKAESVKPILNPEVNLAAGGGAFSHWFVSHICSLVELNQVADPDVDSNHHGNIPFLSWKKDDMFPP